MFKFILFLSVFYVISFPQTLHDWKTYSSKKNIQDAVSVDDVIYAATDGGAFGYNSSGNSFSSFNKTEGLLGVSIVTVGTDNSNNIWFGSSDGILNVYNPQTNSFKSLFDISTSDKPLKNIYKIQSFGDTVIVASDFGISLINSNDLLFLDTYFKFGSLPSNNKVVGFIKKDLLFVSTGDNVARQKSTSESLSLPDGWLVFDPTSGLPSSGFGDFILYKDQICVNNTNGIYSYDKNSDKWSLLVNIPGLNLISSVVVNDTIFFFDGYTNSVYSFFNNTVNVFNSGTTVKKLIYNSKLGLLGTTNNGIYSFSTNSYIVPNGPAANQFPEITIDKNGDLWSASGDDVNGKGFYRLHNGEWTNFSTVNFPGYNNYFQFIQACPDGNVYFGNWGNGFVRLKDSVFTVFRSSDIPLQGIRENSSYLVATSFANDSKNNLWILSYGAIDNKPLGLLTKDSVWYTFALPAMNSKYYLTNYSLVIDQYDTKWFASLDPQKTGLFFFNENNTITNINDDYSGFLNSSSGLNNDHINSLAIDKRGDLWIGTSFGVNIISNTGEALNTSPQFRISSVFALRQQNINTIAVDPVNQKWIGTDQGLLLVNADGTDLLGTFNSQNSPLPKDAIRDIAVDENKGIIYVSTEDAIVSFLTPYQKPVDAFTNLFTYPSPFVLDGSNNNLTITGLIKDAQIKIFNLNGSLVNEFASPGGNIAFWDGKDKDGKFVGSGIYLITAFDNEGNNITTSKIAVIRK